MANLWEKCYRMLKDWSETDHFEFSGRHRNPLYRRCLAETENIFPFVMDLHENDVENYTGYPPEYAKRRKDVMRNYRLLIRHCTTAYPLEMPRKTKHETA